MTAEQLLAQGAIYFEQIGAGLQNPEQYDSEIIRMNPAEAYESLLKTWEKSGKERGFCDFYYFRLDEDARNRVDMWLTETEKTYLERMEQELERSGSRGHVIFPLTRPLLEIAVKLNAQAVLFSTFYFTGEVEERSAWWGNYNQEYVVFRQKRYGNLRVIK